MNLISEALKTAFESRRKKNPSYSLRAFAKFLEIDAPTLSKILNNKKTPGPRLAQRMANKIALSPERQRILLNSYASLESLKSSSDSSFQVLQDDKFQSLSSWHYYAILECLELHDFDPSAQGISKRIGISVIEAKVALERLERLKMIEVTQGRFRDLTEGKTTSLSQDLTSGARREHQRQILIKAVEALETVDVSRRDQSSMTFAINTNDIPKVKDLIKQFRRKLSKFVNEAPVKDEVYNLSLSFYPVSEKLEGKKND